MELHKCADGKFIAIFTQNEIRFIRNIVCGPADASIIKAVKLGRLDSAFTHKSKDQLRAILKSLDTELSAKFDEIVGKYEDIR